MSKDYEINCCRKAYLAKRYSVKPYIEGITTEEFKTIEYTDKDGIKQNSCPVCGVLIVERLRINKDKRRFTKRLGGKDAESYLKELKYLENYYKGKKAYCTEMFDKKIEAGSKSNLNWLHQKNGSIYNHNGKNVTYTTNTIKASFTPEQNLIAV